MVELTRLSACLQELFGPVAQFLAGWVGFIVLQRKLTGPAVARALVFRWMADPRATLEDIASDLGVSPQALTKRLDRKSHAFFRALISQALARLAGARFAAHSLGLLRAFPAVVVCDCTTVTLPAGLAGLFPGCGAGGKGKGHGAAAVKILLRYELKTGRLLELSFHPARTNDADLAARPADLPPGCLHLADLGFFGAAGLGLLSGRCHWISRIPPGTYVRPEGGQWGPLGRWLASLRGQAGDCAGELTESVGTACRLVALRCPEGVAAQRRRELRRRRRRKGKPEPGAEQLALCDWTVLATSVPAEVLGPREVWLAYRCRWQVELLFERAKGVAGWSFTRGVKGDRVLAELLAKVLGLIVMHWASLLRGPACAGLNATRLFELVRRSAERLNEALDGGEAAVQKVLRRLLEELQKVKPRRTRRNKPSTIDLLNDPALAA